MKIFSDSENDILIRADRLGYSVQESLSFKECYFIVDKSTNVVVTGAKNFMAWEEVVRWVVEADTGPILH